ncbi:MAG: dihydroorotase [Pseudomonadota bacterium]
MSVTAIINGTLVNEGRVFESDILIKDGRIEAIGAGLSVPEGASVFDAAGGTVMPGMIDDQVHFREPGLTKKGDLHTESGAAVAGGITSFMEMPNTNPSTSTRSALADKYAAADGRAHGNYAFYLGATPDNIEEIKALETGEACGVKIFMGASTGDLLVNQLPALERIFEHCPTIITTHCEDTPRIRDNVKKAIAEFGEDIPMSEHRIIRDAEACWMSSSLAVDLAKRFGSNLHVLHLTTAREMAHFEPGPIEGKKITAEACVHHLFFDDKDIPAKDTLIKCNPAIKTGDDRAALLQAVNDDRIDIIATDHAPHTMAEKQQKYMQAPAGLPLVQHALLTLFEHYHDGTFSLEHIVHKVAHAPAIRFGVQERGYLREGYFADIVVAEHGAPFKVQPEQLLAKCGWSPFDGDTFRSRIRATFVNGSQVWDGERLLVEPQGQRLALNPPL